MQRIKLIIEYDGGGFAGWQYQTGQPTIQAEIENALHIIFKKNIKITGAGRTDAGVHARGQVAHLDIPECDLYKLQRSLNGILPKQIVIKKAENCDIDFHARFSAVSRRYRYYISLQPLAINRHQAWYINYRLNLQSMKRAAAIIAETSDFQAFCKIKSEVNHYRCHIFRSRWFYKDELLIYEVKANRFLHGMVRALTGAMIDVGRGHFTLNEFSGIIKAKDRTLLRTTAPAKGLILEEVDY